MNGAGAGNVPILGSAVQLEIDELLTVPVAYIDVLDGGLGIGDAEHHVRVILPHKRSALLLPVNRRLLAALHTRIAQAIDPQNHSTTIGANDDQQH